MTSEEVRPAQMTEDDIRVAILRAVALTHGYENPSVERGGYWDNKCAPVYAAFAAGRQAVSDGSYYWGQKDALSDFLEDVERLIGERQARFRDDF